MSEEKLVRHIRLCRALGAEAFRRMILRLEGLRHKRDGGRNANYHMDGISPPDIARFRAFISYHVRIHIAGAAFGAFYLVLRIAFIGPKAALIPLDTAAALALTGHLYCLMLQRYLYLLTLRHECLRRRSAESRAARLGSAAGRVYGASGAAERDLRRLRRLRDGLVSGAADIGKDDTDTLIRLAVWQTEAGLAPRDESRTEAPRKPETADETAPVLSDISPRRVCADVERRADRSLRARYGGRTPILSPRTVTSDDADAFQALCRISSGGDGARLFMAVDSAVICLERMTANGGNDA